MTAIVNKISGYLLSFTEWWVSEISDLYSSIYNKLNSEKLYISILNDKSVTVHGTTEGKVLYEQEVVVDDAHFLRKKVLLPLSARKNLRELVGCEFSKYFPVNVEDVVFGFSSAISENKELLEVDVYALPREFIDDVIIKVNDETGSSVKSMVLVNSKHEYKILYKNNEYKSSSGKFLNKQTVIIAAIAFTAVLLLPALKMKLYVDNLSEDIEKMKISLKQEIQYDSEMKMAEERVRIIFSDKSETRSMLHILSKVTDAVHGNAVLNRIQVYHGRIEIEGNVLNINKLETKLKTLSNDGVVDFKVVNQRLKRPGFIAKFSYE